MVLDTRLKLFLTLAAVFVTCLLVGDILGGKLVPLPFLLFGKREVISAGMLAFPITFLLTDLLNEFYGKQAARTVTWVGFGMAVLCFSIVTVASALPFAPFTSNPDWDGINQPSFDKVFGSGQRILAASMVAYLVAQFIDIAVFHRLKKLSGARFLWLRATGSTVASQLIDTVVITFGAWTGLRSTGEILSMIGISYAMKLVIAVGMTPLIYAGHAVLQKSLGLEPAPVIQD